MNKLTPNLTRISLHFIKKKQKDGAGGGGEKVQKVPNQKVGFKASDASLQKFAFNIKQRSLVF